MTEEKHGNNKSEIKWAEDTKKEHPATALDKFGNTTVFLQTHIASNDHRQ